MFLTSSFTGYFDFKVDFIPRRNKEEHTIALVLNVAEPAAMAERDADPFQAVIHIKQSNVIKNIFEPFRYVH